MGDSALEYIIYLGVSGVVVVAALSTFNWMVHIMQNLF